jgi:selenophosphate synthase
MGGAPTIALAILGMPLGKIAPETARMILEGGRAVCTEAAFRSQAGIRSIARSRSIASRLWDLPPGKHSTQCRRED